jgi:hypothetical protein
MVTEMIPEEEIKRLEFYKYIWTRPRYVYADDGYYSR